MDIKATNAERWRYRIDNFLGKGNRLFMALVAAFVISIALVSVLRWLVLGIESYVGSGAGTGLVSEGLFGVWVTWLQITDPGNMAQDNDTFGLYKVPAVVGGLTGVVIFSALIAFLTTALDQAIENLKKGHSRVLETGHTLIVGWGPRVLEILRELVEANESEDDPVVVILADEDKEVMDAWLLDNWTDRRNTRVVTAPAAPSLPPLRKSAPSTPTARSFWPMTVGSRSVQPDGERRQGDQDGSGTRGSRGRCAPHPDRGGGVRRPEPQRGQGDFA